MQMMDSTTTMGDSVVVPEIYRQYCRKVSEDVTQ